MAVKHRKLLNLCISLKLQVFVNKCLSTIKRTFLTKHFSNAALLSCSNQTLIANDIRRRKWIGHAPEKTS